MRPALSLPYNSAPFPPPARMNDLATIHTRAPLSMHAPLVRVEVHLASGLPAMTLVGLPEKAVKESKDRVRAAILNSGETHHHQPRPGRIAERRRALRPRHRPRHPRRIRTNPGRRH